MSSICCWFMVWISSIFWSVEASRLTKWQPAPYPRRTSCAGAGLPGHQIPISDACAVLRANNPGHKRAPCEQSRSCNSGFVGSGSFVLSSRRSSGSGSATHTRSGSRPRASGCGGLWRLDLTVLTPTGKNSCLARELQQEKLVVVDLRRGVGAGVSRGCSSGKYFSTDSHATVQLFPQYRAVGGAREDHQ